MREKIRTLSFFLPPHDTKGGGGQPRRHTIADAQPTVRKKRGPHSPEPEAALTVLRYDARDGKDRGTVDFGTNLGGGSGCRYAANSSGKFSFSGVPAEMWGGPGFEQGVLPTIAEDLFHNSLPPVSFYHRRGGGIPLKIDFDAKDDVAYTEDQMLNLARVSSSRTSCASTTGSTTRRGRTTWPSSWPAPSPASCPAPSCAAAATRSGRTRAGYSAAPARRDDLQPHHRDAGGPRGEAHLQNGFHLHGIQVRDPRARPTTWTGAAPCSTPPNLMVRNHPHPLAARLRADLITPWTSPLRFHRPRHRGQQEQRLERVPARGRGPEDHGCDCVAAKIPVLHLLVIRGTGKKYRLIENRRYLPKYVLTAGGHCTRRRSGCATLTA